MALLESMVHQLSSTAPGTGDVSLPAAAASAGRRTFVEAVGDGNECFYFLEGTSGSEWGRGTVSGTTTGTLARTTVIGNSNGTTAKINFTGVVNAWVGLPAEKMVLTVNGTAPDGSGNIAVTGIPSGGAFGAVLAKNSASDGDAGWRVAGQLPGTTTNDDATAGNIGQIVESEIPSGSAVSLGTSGSVKNITSIALSAGDWDVEGNIIFSPLGGNLTAAVATMNTASATFPTRPNGGAYAQVGGISTISVQALVTGRRRYSFATPTTVYLIAYADFAGTPTAYGYIGARRIR